MFWWSYYWSQQGGDQNWINSKFAEVSSEFRKFTDLITPAHKPDIFVRAPDGAVRMARWRRSTGDWLVMVNASAATRVLNRWTENKITKAKLIPWGSTRQTGAKIEKGRVTTVEKAEPWEVFIWEIRESPVAEKPTGIDKTGDLKN